MKKQVTRTVCVMLSLLLAVQLLPVGTFSLSLPAKAENAIPEPEAYEFTIPSESGPFPNPTVPDSFIPEPDEAIPTPSPSPLTATEMADANRYFTLLGGGLNYNSLSSEDAAFLCAYAGVSPTDMTALSSAGVGLALSIEYALLSEAFGLGLQAILSRAPTASECTQLYIEIGIYNRCVRSDLPSATDTELRGLILQGSSFEQVSSAYGVEQALDIDKQELLGFDPGIFSSELTEEEVGIFVAAANELGLSATAIASTTQANDVSAQELQAATPQIQQYASSLTLSPNTTDGDGSGLSTVKGGYVSAPYTYVSGDSEKTSLNTGTLIIETEDYVLPGINGLDLVIGRRYDSQEAGVYTPSVNVGTYAVYTYLVVYGYIAYSDVPGIGESRWPYYDEECAASFSSHWEATQFRQNLIDDRTTIVIPDLDDDVDLILVPYVYPVAGFVTGYGSYNYSGTQDNGYLNDLYGLGQGWGLLFSSIEDDRYLHLSNGATYEIAMNGPNDSNLKDYTLEDLRLETENAAYNNGSKDSKYTLYHKDGTREYFSADGKLIAIRDRYDNTIKFVHTTQNGYPHITITDTLGRVTTISGAANDSGHTMTVELPEAVTLRYDIEDFSELVNNRTVNTTALTKYRDAVGADTQYSYTIQSAGFNTVSKTVENTTNYYVNLTTVTHPTQVQSIYTYETVVRNLGSSGLMEAYRLVSRKDMIGGAEHNKLNYTYSANDSSGYPQHNNPNSLPNTFTYTATITDSDSVATVVTFNNKHLQTDNTVKQGATLLRKTEYEYNADKLPIKVTSKSYSPGNQATPLTSVAAAAYDEKGNVTAEWSTMAEGDTTNTEHKTIYTYDSTYCLPLSRTYKTDAQTTVELRNTLDSAKKNIVRTELYENGTLKQRTDYAYDTRGNTTQVKRYKDGFTGYYQTDYTYQSNAYLSQEKHTGVLNADGTAAVSTPGQAAGTIATSYTYDTLGRMTSVTDGSGNTTGYAYDALGNVTQVTNPDETSVTYSRNYTQNTVTVTDESSNAVKYTYTPLGLEFETVDIQTGKVMFRKEYDENSRLIKSSEYIYGGVTEYAYDALSRVTSETAKQGALVLAQTLYAYDDAAGNGAWGKVTATVVGGTNAPSVVTTEYTDKHGNLAKTGKFLNGVEYFDTFTYNYVGAVLTQLAAADEAKDLDYTVRYTYDGAGQIVRTYNALEQYTANTHDALGRLVSTTDYAGTPTAYTYDALGRLLSQTITIDTGVTATTKYDYDASGNLIREYKPVNAVGSAAAWEKTEYAYDSRGRLSAVSQYDGGVLESATRYTYDGVGNMLTMTTGLSSPTATGGQTTTYTYGRFGNVLTETNALGQTESYTYNTLGRLEKKTARTGTETTYTYDALGRETTILAVGGQSIEMCQYSYTKTGQLHSEYNGWNLSTYTYDELGRVIKTDDEAQGTDVYIVKLDANGGTVSQDVIFVHAGGTYDLPTPARDGHTFSGWYLDGTKINSEGPVLQQDCVLTAVWDIAYYEIAFYYNTPWDQNIDSPNIVYSLAYSDTFEMPYPNITHPPVSLEQGGYVFLGWRKDGVGELYEMGDIVEVLGGASYYGVWDDGAEHIPEPIHTPSVMSLEAPSTTSTIPYTTTYTYDLAGNRTGSTLKRGKQTIQAASYTYDTLNRLSTVSEDGDLQATYTYDTNGNRASLSYANGVAATYSYNKANWVTSLTNAKGTDTLSSYAYAYYASGHQKTKTDHTGKVTSYEYDGLGRLTRESETNGLTLAYSYDLRGNRTQLAASGTESYTTAYSYDAASRLLTEVKTQGENATTTSYTYDANGNTLTKTSPAGSESYTYDAFDQLIGVTAGGVTTSYVYNARGLRTSKTTGGSRTDFLLDGGNVVAEAANGSVTATYLRGLNLISRTAGTATSYYSFNAHGDVVKLTNAGGAVTKSYDYDAFGVEKAPAANDANPFRYCGEYFDAETGTYYLRARYYAPALGRFTQQDTHWNTANMIYGDDPQKSNEREDALGLKYYSYAPQITAVMQSGNLYVYCINNPIIYSDPFGYWTLSIGAEIAAALGFKIGANVQLVFDGHGNVGIITTGIVGAGTPNVSGSIIFMATNADTIFDLEGVSYSTGGSLLFGGFEIVGDGVDMVGTIASVGTSVLPAGLSAEISYSTVKQNVYTFVLGLLYSFLIRSIVESFNDEVQEYLLETFGIGID